MKNKLWTNEEISKLYELYPSMSYKEIAIVLGRTVNAVRAKCNSLSLTFKSNYKKWNEDQDNELIDLYKSKSSDEIAIIMNRSISSIHNRVNYLNLAKLEGIGLCSSKIKAKYPNLEVVEFNGIRSLALIKDLGCGHTWRAVPQNIYLLGLANKCPVCNSTNIKYTDETLLLKIQKTYPNIVSAHKCKDTITITYNCNHTTTVNLSHLLLRGDKSICRVCNPIKYPTKSHEVFIDQVFNINPDIKVLDTYINDRTYINVTSNCGHTWGILPNNFLSKSTGSICPICNPRKTSKGEIYLSQILSNYTDVELRNRSILEGKEIDIYLPKFKLGIEYNGEYWHSEDKKLDKYYHLNKTKLAASKGIQLIQIFEHEWLNKKEIVQSRLVNKLGLNYKLGARLCNIVEIEFPGDFLDNNHLQGAGAFTSINLGLYYKEILVAVMTFSKPRFNATFDYELVRYASLTGVNIVGGASKLLKYFTKYYTGSIISYSDKRWSTGDLYNTLGFQYSHSSEPSYFYYKSGNILSRYQCQKHKLSNLFPKIYKDELTESTILSLAGYSKVYDCGNDVWVLKPEQTSIAHI